MVYIGIDPGAKGGFSILECNSDGQIVEASSNSFDEALFIEQMRNFYSPVSVMCCLERVNAMPGQGVTSMFHFGENFGLIQGILKAFVIPYELVTPQKWKKEFGITKDKNTSIQVAQRLFPNVDLKRTPRCKKIDDGMAESLLMAEYARRKL